MSYEDDVLSDEEHAEIDRQVAYEQTQENLYPGIGPEPKPGDFDDYDKYVVALTDQKLKIAKAEIEQTQGQREATQRTRDIMFQDVDPATMVQGAVKDGMMQAWQEQQQAQARARQDIGPIPDDPYKQERADLIRQSLDYSRQAIMCAESGKTDKAREWRERQQMVERALERLPPSPEQQYAEDMIDQMDERGLALLMNPANAGHPAWSDERMANDAGVVVSRALERAKSTLRLPLLDSPYGNPLKIAPENMVEIKLSPDDMKSFQAQL